MTRNVMSIRKELCSYGLMADLSVYTPQPLYNTIVGVHDNFRVSYPIRVITRVKYIDK